MYRLNLFKDSIFTNVNDYINETSNFVERNLKKSNVTVNDHEYNIDIAIPGLSKEDVKIEVLNSILSISHEKEKRDDETFYFTTSFNKRYELPDDVDIKQISAKIEKGVLFVKIPKDKEKINKHIVDIK